MPMRLQHWFASLRQDIGHGFRQRLRAPGLTAVAVLTLALGIGLTTTVFALVDGVMLRPLPFPDPDRLVALQSVDSAGAIIRSVSAENWTDWKEENRTLAGVALYMGDGASVVVGTEALRVRSQLVTPGFFEVMGMRLVTGRPFTEDEVTRGERVVVVSEGFWRRQLGASRDSGLVIQVNGFPYDVIGVVAQEQVFPERTEVWTPYRHRQQSRNNINWFAVGRLEPGVSIPRARDDLGVVARRILEEDPATLYSHGVHVMPLRDRIVGDTTSLLEMLLGAVALVLLITCANLASANLAQGAQRAREMAVRSALGASGGRLVRQVLVDHVVLALIGGASGAFLAWGLTRSATLLAASHLPRATEIGVDLRVLAVAFLISTIAGLLTGILPALQASRAAPNNAIGAGTRGAVGGGRGLPGRMLVGAEIAMALMLVAGAGLLVQSLRAVLARPLGFETNGVATAEVILGGPRYQNDSLAVLTYWRTLLDSLRAIPGARGAGLANWVPLVRGGTGFIEIAGKDIPGAGAGYRVISDGYFETLGMHVLEGRSFDERDRTESPRVAVINRRMAERFWPGESPLGRMVRATSMEPGARGTPAPWITVIGVVSDVRHFGYESEPVAEMFVLYRQLMPAWRISSLTAIVRATGPEERLLQGVRERVRAIDPMIPAEIGLLSSEAARVTASRRFAMLVMTVFGSLSLFLAGIGVFGVLSFSVARRTREMAVRAALGADRRSLLSLVIRSGGRVVAAGAAVGLAGAILLAGLLSNLLYEVSPRDPAVLAAATLAIAAVGLAATILPARRATRADPMVALREE
ncbi:MAG TPA: ABC transporter permease [Gemmatimonadaceae bacterium]|nr:ABC transporter permease [Gemmatimonadaceae bacterium]